LLAPFFAGFLEPSRRTWSRLIPRSVWYRSANCRQARWNTPSASQTANRRWTVLWDANPAGSSSRGIPATNTYSKA
jgi:hypothetical protein